MHIAIPAEQAAGESRVAATPDTVKKYVALGHSVAVETGAGRASAVLDEAYIAAGATVVGDRSALLAAADIVLTVRTLPAGELAQWIASDSNQQRGECVLIIDAAAPSTASMTACANTSASEWPSRPFS